MSAPTLRISTNEVRAIGGEIIGYSSDLHRQLTTIKQAMQQTGEKWKGSAADEIRANFESAANKFFDKYKEIIDNYGEFLKITVAQSYDELEQQLTSNASQFKI